MSRHRGAKPAVDVDSWAKITCYPRVPFYPLSDGIPLSRGSLEPTFSSLLGLSPRSRARLHSCAPGTVADRPERPCAPPVTIWEATAPVKLPAWYIPAPGLLPRVSRRHGEGGIPGRLPGLAPGVRSLPPILYTPYQRPMPGCSEGSRGLSVLRRQLASSRTVQFRRPMVETALVVTLFVQVGTFRQGISLP